MNVYLVGYRCCGKSSLGAHLAGRLGWSFADTDRLVSEQAGQSIADMVKRHGWDHFRQMERDILNVVASKQRQVVATGGGIVLDAANVKCMQATGVVVWLRASPDTIRQRMTEDRLTANQRPALTGGQADSEIVEVLNRRTPLYRAAGDFVIDTDNAPVQVLVEALEAQLQRSGRLNFAPDESDK
jgi:shikimate kinase